jgi:hypothetical protein
MASAASGGSSAMSVTQINSAISSAILTNGVARLQQIYSQSVTPANLNGPISIYPNNVGIIRGFLVKISGTLKNTGSGTANLTALGLSNLLSNVTFQDFSNVTRINTTGWHLTQLATAKGGAPFVGAVAFNVGESYGNNWGLQYAPATLATTASTTFNYYYYVPLAYAQTDLRGAVFAGLVGATANLQLTLNPTPFAATGDATLSIYSGQAGSFNGNVTVSVWQDYIDQLPTYAQLGLTPASGVSSASPALPPVSMSTIYELINTSQTGIVQGQDFGVPFTNLRTFMSTTMIYDNAGTLNIGTDINYWALTLANSANIWKYTPDIATVKARQSFMCDPPPGMYYFDSRVSPINTQQYGNAQIVLNASLVNTGASLLIGYESFAMTQTLVGAPSVPS